MLPWELTDKGFDVHFVGVHGWMEKSGKTVEFVRRGNRFLLPVTLRTDQNENYKKLCPLEGQRLDVAGAEENEQAEEQAGDMHEDMDGETPAGPAPKAMKEEIPPTEAEIKQHNLTHANYAP